MTYHSDTPWRIVCLMHCDDMDVHFLHDIFGPTPRTIFRWYKLFKTKGLVDAQGKKNKVEMARGSSTGGGKLLEQPPNFYLEELQGYVTEKFDLQNFSLSTICRTFSFN